MKKLVSFILTGVMIVSLAACGSSPTAEFKAHNISKGTKTATTRIVKDNPFDKDEAGVTTPTKGHKPYDNPVKIHKNI